MHLSSTLMLFRTDSIGSGGSHRGRTQYHFPLLELGLIWWLRTYMWRHAFIKTNWTRPDVNQTWQEKKNKKSSKGEFPFNRGLCRFPVARFSGVVALCLKEWRLLVFVAVRTLAEVAPPLGVAEGHVYAFGRVFGHAQLIANVLPLIRVPSSCKIRAKWNCFRVIVNL